MKVPSISKPSAAQAVKATYYAAVVVALVVGALAARGLLGHSAFGAHAQHFMNTTLPQHLSPAFWPAIGFGAGIAPMALKGLVEGVKKCAGKKAPKADEFYFDFASGRTAETASDRSSDSEHEETYTIFDK